MRMYPSIRTESWDLKLDTSKGFELYCGKPREYPPEEKDKTSTLAYIVPANEECHCETETIRVQASGRVTQAQYMSCSLLLTCFESSKR